MQGVIELTIVMATILYWGIDKSEKNRIKVVIILTALYGLINCKAETFLEDNYNLGMAISLFEHILRVLILWVATKDGIRYWIKLIFYLYIYNVVSMILFYIMKIVFSYDKAIENSIYAIHSDDVSVIYMVVGLSVVYFLIKKEIVEKLPYKIVRNITCTLAAIEYVAVFFVLWTGKMNSSTVNSLLIVECYIIIVAVFFMIWYRGRAIKEKESMYENIIQKNYLTYKKVYMQQQAVRNFRHNLANHIEVMSNLNENGQEAIKSKYENELIESYSYYFEKNPARDDFQEEDLGEQETINKNKQIALIVMCFVLPIIITLIWGARQYDTWWLVKTALLFELVGGILYFSFKVKLQENNSEQMKELLDKGNDVKQKWDKIQNSISECIGERDRNESLQLDMQKLSEIVNVHNVSFTTNEIVNVMLNSKKDKCDENGIASDWNIDIPALHNISEVDLIEILSNLLDNAIEACLRVENQEKKITVNAKNRANFWALSIENSKNENEKPIKSKFKTTKNGEHGYGMDIIKSIVKKYKGVLEYKDLGDTFKVDIMINVDKN